MTRQPFPAFNFETQLGGSTFRLRFAWNSRFLFWVVDLLRADGTAICEGRKLLLGVPLYEDVVVDGLPAPAIIALAPSGDVQRIGFGDLGQRVGVYTIGAGNAV